MNKLLAALALLAVSGAAGAAPARAAAPPAADAPAAQAYDLRVRVWADSDRDLFRPGERVRVQFHATQSAYVAVIHLTTDGEVEFVYPASPWDDGYVAGGRNYSLPVGGMSGSWRVRGSPGIGYLYVVASDRPLDFGAFQNRSGSAWEYRRIGAGVRGDPYYALDRITELLVPDWEYGEYATDYYAYHVGTSRHAYPRYACWDGYADAYSWGGHYDRCDRLVVLLRDDPYYYDPRRYRRSHGYYLADGRRTQPEHRYKEPRAAVGRDSDYGRGRDSRVPPLRRPRSGGAPEDVTRTRPQPRSRVDAPVMERRNDFQERQRQTEQERKRAREEQERRRAREDERSRPVLQRRPTEPETSRPRVTAPQREPRREAPPERARSEPPPRQERSRPSGNGSARVRPEGNS